MKAMAILTPMVAGTALIVAGPAVAGDMVVLTATLAGVNETGGGDPDGSGKFRAEIDADSGDLCFTLTAEGIGEPTAAHIHVGAAGVDGDPVATIGVTGPDGDECIALPRETAKAIVATPGGYYVNVHDATFPKGAVRGQLAKE